MLDSTAELVKRNSNSDSNTISSSRYIYMHAYRHLRCEIWYNAVLDSIAELVKRGSNSNSSNTISILCTRHI